MISDERPRLTLRRPVRMCLLAVLLSTVTMIDGRAEVCSPHPSRSNIVTELMGRPMRRTTTAGFGSYEANGGASEKGVRVDLSLPLLGHYTSMSQPQALVVLRELHAESSPDLRCRAAVLEAAISGDGPNWSRVVMTTDHDPRFCGELERSAEDAASGKVTLSGRVAPERSSRITACVRWDKGEPVFTTSSEEHAPGGAPDASFVVDELQRIVGAVAIDADPRPAWDYRLMTLLKQEFAGQPPRGEFDIGRRERVFMTDDAATLLALRLYSEKLGLTAYERYSVSITNDGATASRALRVTD